MPELTSYSVVWKKINDNTFKEAYYLREVRQVEKWDLFRGKFKSQFGRSKNFKAKFSKVLNGH